MKQGAVVACVVALAVFLSNCGKDNPTTPPSPVAIATPTPTPTPSPTPTPTPTPRPSGQACGAAPVPECSLPGGGGCCRQQTDVLGELVELSIRQVQQDRPELFDGDKLRDSNDATLIVQLTARTLEQRFGLCAKAESPVEDEVAVKRTNEFSEQYDIIIGDGLSVNIHGYTVTCRPARF